MGGGSILILNQALWNYLTWLGGIVPLIDIANSKRPKNR
jgi:hypothetical protein